MFKTDITRLFDITHPIIQGGMQRVAKAELVSAVANAGALGMLSALTQATPDDLRKEIQRTRNLTDKPFGVNLTLLPTRKPPPYDEYVDSIIESGVTIVETAGRSPESFMNRFKQAGVRVIHKCTSVRHALKAQTIGCDAVTIDGFECAGHPGEDDIPSLVLTRRAVQTMDIPVVACGGIADGRGLLAALALGAQGVCMGTRFMVTREAPIHEAIKKQLVAASELDTHLILRSLKNTARVFKNRVAETVADIESHGPVTFDVLAPHVLGEKGAVALETGDIDAGLVWAGLSVGLIHDVPMVTELVERIVIEAKESLGCLNRLWDQRHFNVGAATHGLDAPP